MTDIIKFTTYHGTCSKYKKSIEQFGFRPDLVKYRDDHWLGQGVYFFELESLAEWWANDQSKKPWNQRTTPLVYSCDISVNQEQYLDLDDTRTLDKFYDYCYKLIEKVNNDTSIETKPVFTDQKFRAVLFDYYKKENNISVIAYTFQKACTSFAKRRSPSELKSINSLSSVLDLRYKERQICVSSSACLGPPVLVFRDDEEVI